jgi:hypothetical protein
MIQYVEKGGAANEEWDQRYCEIEVMDQGGIAALEAKAAKIAMDCFPANEDEVFILPDYKILSMGPKISRAAIKVYRRK